MTNIVAATAQLTDICGHTIKEKEMLA